MWDKMLRYKIGIVLYIMYSANEFYVHGIKEMQELEIALMIWGSHKPDIHSKT